jgi:hypothetical protein
MPEHAQIPFVNAFQWPLRHDVGFMVAYPYLVKNTGIISMEIARKLPEKRLKK